MNHNDSWLCFEEASCTAEPMGNFAKPNYSRTQVERAGKVLKGIIPVPDTQEKADDLAGWFRIAHNWRAAHMLPMHVIRADLRGKARRIQCDAVVVARLKRMASIRKKLRGRALDQIQDIAGARVIFTDMPRVTAAVTEYLSGNSRHVLAVHDDYISVPKPDGYRGHHLILRYTGGLTTGAWSGLRVEIQLRTQMQHAWATAVEAVGLYRNEDLKGKRGSADWLRVFQLMSSEIAKAEGLPIVPGTPASDAERRYELSALTEKLEAIQTLESFRTAIRGTDDFIRPDSGYYLIQYDHRTNRVTVRPYDSVMAGNAAFDQEEESKDPKNAVLVEVDKVEDLKEAYPNYFLDVGLFTAGLKNVLKGSSVALPREAVPSPPPRSGLAPDLAAFLKRWHRPHRNS